MNSPSAGTLQDQTMLFEHEKEVVRINGSAAVTFIAQQCLNDIDFYEARRIALKKVRPALDVHPPHVRNAILSVIQSIEPYDMPRKVSKHWSESFLASAEELRGKPYSGFERFFYRMTGMFLFR